MLDSNSSIHRVQPSEQIPNDAMSNLGVTVAQMAMDRDRLIKLALRGLARMIGEHGAIPHTLKRHVNDHNSGYITVGTNLRYLSIVALGLNRTSLDIQREILKGKTAADLAELAVERASSSDDLGAVALAIWAHAEILGLAAGKLLKRVSNELRTRPNIKTVDCAWVLTAAIASKDHTGGRQILEAARGKLLAAQSESGLFKNSVGANQIRANFSCFADQIYPIQALSRLALHCEDTEALTSAERCARAICELQGNAGQWWWHYDCRIGAVLEGYPVYSVHQHAMAPMALFELMAAGGNRDHRASIAKGLNWLVTHPETPEHLINHQEGIIWRKVARRERGRAARRLSAAAALLHAGWKLPYADVLFPPSEVDFECRPYEFGWLIYAWNGPTGVASATLT